jgi:predicted nucleic acid-binding protein
MILVDTSVWIDHLRAGDRDLAGLLLGGEACCHPLIIGELACGTLHRRQEIIGLLQALPNLDRVADEEALFFIERHRLHGKGLGLIDVHLLAASSLGSARLWTRDKRLKKAAQDLELGAEIQ